MGDAAPVADVHAITTADATVSNSEVSPPASFKTRQLKITDAPVEGSHPGLRIQGRWLAEAGFSVGGDVRISVSWQRLLIEVLRPDCVTHRPTTRDERHLALKETLLSCRTDFAAASHLTRSCRDVPQHGDSQPRTEQRASRVEDSAKVPTTDHAPQINEQPQDLKFSGSAWPDRISTLVKPALGDILHKEQSRLRLCPKSIGARAQCDVSTLGKIDLQGPDAAAFLDRVYCNLFSTLPVGKVRYGLMLREDGFVMDDGTTARLGPEHFLMSTTTANAVKVMQHLEHARQVLWPQLDVQIVSVTEQWAQFSIAGPNARRLLVRLLAVSIDVSDAAFPYLACGEFHWRGLPARLFRISFSGELAYELAVPARYGDATARAIMAAGEGLGISPYGTEALGVMRIEKGHIAGNEINGTTTAADLGLGRMVSTKKDCIGRVLASRPALTDGERGALVGIKPVDRSARLHAGAHFVALGAGGTLDNDEGYITSVACSPMLGHWIGLGLLKRGSRRIGEQLRAYDPVRNGDVAVEVVSPVFFDPEGVRLRG